MRELVRRTDLCAIAGEHAGGRVVQRQCLAGAERVAAQRRVERLVVLRERALGHAGLGEEAGDAFRVHDERAHAAGGIFVGLEVRHVHAAPVLAVPGQQRAARIERLAGHVARRAVVHHAAVGRPRPGPAQRVADAGGVAVVTPPSVAGRAQAPM
jgi:hypothetical protein